MDPRYAAVVDALSDYFDGLYLSDTDILSRVFHPDARYVCATEPTLVNFGMDEYLPIVARRPSPASRGEERRDRIAGIEFAGPATAFARVHCAIGPKHFTDFLTLIETDGRWRIIAKVFHFDLVDTAAA
ncbi:MAG: nuclear transport factor 2 family protein [Thalassobaculum sp.]|uniref:nuclear transport factor 2 family protein n=1 Tax=Thalassobaculum sp. TaxID=2022740 RepID=UPI0032EE57C2